MARLRQRLDLLLVERGLAPSREKAQALIMAGEVFVDGSRANRAAEAVAPDSSLEVRGGLPFVSRGGHKLSAALDRFAINVSGKVCGDIGASTGGFTDVLLQRGAAKIYAVDVGYGQLDWKLRNDPRVVVMERTNIRTLETLPESLAFACVDVSFISLRLVLPVVLRFMGAEPWNVVALIKPQFEAGKGQVGKGGVVRDPRIHRTVLDTMREFCVSSGWGVDGLMVSPIKGPAGNIEFLVSLAPGETPRATMAALIDSALAEAQSL